MKVLILGLGLHGGGFAAATYFADRGDTVRVTDTAERSKFGAIPDLLERKGVTCNFGAQTKKDILWADVVIKNPAIPATSPLLTYAKQIETDISLLFKSPDLKKTKIITVTGTKGKTTTVSAIADALKRQGKEVFVCGNIGISGFFALQEIERLKAEGKPVFEYLVVELSSWQIHDAYISLGGKWPKMETVVLTNIFLDHQNTYSSLYTYTMDKIQLFYAPAKYRLIPKNQKAFFEKMLNLDKIPCRTFPRFSNPFKSEKKELMPAFEALRCLKIEKGTAESLLKQYRGTPHRSEQVALKNNIMYINDSAATIAEAVAFSVGNVKPLSFHLICGGTDKNLPADSMAKSLKEASSISLLDGTFTRGKLIPLLESLSLSYDGPFKSMEAAFENADIKAKQKERETKKTQVVILSPGAASFGIFKNEFDRGDAFKAEVRKATSGKSGT
jgi:UDP-N-acetylmuramoylalanine-D-glutamate ligase